MKLSVVGVALLVAACGSVANEKKPDAAVVVEIDAPVQTGCTDVVDDANCGAGMLCIGGACVAGQCRDSGDCAFPKRCMVATHTCSLTGTGEDGDLSIPSGDSTFTPASTRVTAIAGATLTTVTVPFSVGDEVLLINLQGSAANVTSTGNRELFTIASASASGVVLDHAPKLPYGVGGTNDLTGQRVHLVGISNYATVTVTGRLLAAQWWGGGLGIVAFRASGGVTIASGGSIDALGAGFLGGGVPCNGPSGRPGEATLPGPPASAGNCVGWDNPNKAARIGGGGGGLSDCNTYACTSQSLGAGGGGAGYGTAGSAGANSGTHMGGDPGMVYGSPQLTQLFLGAAGGGGSGGTGGPASTAAYNGNGGGIIVIAANTITVAGAVTTSGEKGSENSNCALSNGSGSGGGGAGGSVYLAAPTISVSGSIFAKGGVGGCQGGGAAGVGRIRLDCTVCPSTGVDPAPHVGTP